MRFIKPALITGLLLVMGSTIGCSSSPGTSPLSPENAAQSNGPATNSSAQEERLPGDLVFSFHEDRFGCGRINSRTMDCLRDACTTMGGQWDEAGQQCLCSEGVPLVMGRHALCERSVRGRITPGAVLSIGRKATTLSEPTAIVRETENETLSLSRLAHTQVNLYSNADSVTVIEANSRFYGSPSRFSEVRQLPGLIPYEPNREVPFVSPLTFFLASEDQILPAFTRRTFSERVLLPRVTHLKRLGELDDRFSEPLPRDVLPVLDEAFVHFNSLETLPTAKVEFSSISGGCAAGCRLVYPLIRKPTVRYSGFEVVLVRDFTWGSIGYEAIELRAYDSERPAAEVTQARAFLLPSGQLSHIQVRGSLFVLVPQEVQP